MSSIFIYNKAHFEEHFMCYFKHADYIPILKEMLGDIAKHTASKACKERAIKIVRRFQSGQEWWRVDEAKELTLLWRCGRLTLTEIYNPQTVSEYSYERLAEAESDLEKGIINEQRFIERCNTIKMMKEEDEALMNACACKTISSMDAEEVLQYTAEGVEHYVEGEFELTIICLPHDFSMVATVL